MAHPHEPEPLRPMLRTAESQLVERIEEVCAHEVKGESTAELMRLEETLTDAARAAKQAVSLRRRLRTGHGASEPSHLHPEGDLAGATDTASEVDAPAFADDRAGESDDEAAVREFLDERGLAWRVWAVTPEQMQTDRLVADQMGDYRLGWLAFERVDASERRRLPNFPPNWRRLSNLDLEGLLRRADAVRRRRTASEESDSKLA